MVAKCRLSWAFRLVTKSSCLPNENIIISSYDNFEPESGAQKFVENLYMEPYATSFVDGKN